MKRLGVWLKKYIAVLTKAKKKERKADTLKAV